jgi:glutaredoxin
MRSIKNTILTILLVSSFLAAVVSTVLAQDNPTEPDVAVTIFWREGCPHCEEEIPFLQELAVEFPQVTINGFEVGSHNGNREYFFALGDAMGFDTSGVPVTVIGDQYWIGYDEATGEAIRNTVESYLNTGAGDPAERWGIDLSNTTRTLNNMDAQENGSGYTIWIGAAAALVAVSYALGVILGKKKSAAAKSKKH